VKLAGVVAEVESTSSEKVMVTVPVLAFAEQLATVGGVVSQSGIWNVTVAITVHVGVGETPGM
jgi:hypothetical protein